MVIRRLFADEDQNTEITGNKYFILPNKRHCGWRRGVVVSGVRRMNEDSASRAWLLPGCVTIFGRVYHLGML